MNTLIFIFAYEDTETEKIHYCHDNIFKNINIKTQTTSKSLQPKYLKQYNIKVINEMVNPVYRFGPKMTETFFNKFDIHYIKFVFLELLYLIEYYKEQNTIKKYIDYIIKFNDKYNISTSKILQNEKELYQFEKENKQELKNIINLIFKI
ncbi:5343_t:CDS:1 [Cetraspora pellucida]|uniref:5343_t:CDS:1 n=1 Tax=Cetraspora pellucida TaxID=1433469 RepID=A0A9N9P0S5_9GLOM|nr:5343_t:CDS:1 [Cetraspora pellucida]